MSRCPTRPMAPLFALAAALLVSHAVSAADAGASRPRATPKSQSKSKTASTKGKAAARDTAGKKPAPEHAGSERSGGKGKAPEEKRAPAAKPAAAKAAEPKAAPGEKRKSSNQRVPATKQSDAPKHELASATRPVAAKSSAPAREDERARLVEPALKPPGGARPMVRSVGSRLVIPAREVAEQSLAFHYANLGDSEVLAELNRRGIAWVPASPPLPGVRTPIRLSGPLHGVTIHSTLPEFERRASPFEILDARLALALDDFCALLARHDVVELVHYTMYRPPGELPPDLNKQIRHPAGLAIDVGAVRKADGRWLAVGPHWPSDIGAKTCGDGAREHWSRPGREIVSIACEAADLRMFHFILTPHFDAAHADHLHLEIKPDTRWFLVN